MAEVQEKAQEAAGQAKSKIREQVDERSAKAAEQVSSTAADVRTVAEELRKQGKDGPAKIADQAAERAEKVGGYLERSDADRILNDVEDFGRRQPWAVVAGGLALGFVASRLLKASSGERYRTRSGSPASTGSNGSAGQLPGQTFPPPPGQPAPPRPGIAVPVGGSPSGV
ncbi:MAG TPA: hypothetical protein VF545_04075 [Thermoleophilaceae bacterium]|jgi:ElaB/YqjD/DUF883 family membrane-anchored ribosome-binding protein